jgi:N-acetylmuramoyl-L-alanine amidase
MRTLFFLLLSLCSVAAGAAELRDLRLWDGPESTRVVFDLSAPATHKVFTLSNPDRIVIDIDGVGDAGVSVASQAEVKGLVKDVRSGPRKDGSLRIVFDLKQPAKPRSFTLPPNEQYGDRLVLDLYGPTPTLEELAGLPPQATKTTEVAAEVVPAQPAVRFEAKPIVIAIDAGHGGEDPGAISKRGLREKDVALSIARKLAAQINQQPGMKAVLTRDGDYYIGLRERTVKARKAQADMFVSIHCNAYKNADLRGSAVYVLSDRGATSEHARWLAHKENSADLVGGLELSGKDSELAAVLIDLSQASSMEASFDVGSRMLQSLGRINPLQKEDVQQAGFMVLKSPDIPSVLVETAFITNDRDEKLLSDRAHQDKIARSLLDGIQGYFANYRPQQQIVDNSPRLQKVGLSAKDDLGGPEQLAALR